MGICEATVRRRFAAIAGAVVLVAAMLVAWAPSAWAKSEGYPLYVAGTQVTPENAADVLGDGTVAYDASTNTLTLTDAAISASELADGNYYGIAESTSSQFIIELVGDSTIIYDGTTPRDAAYGIYSSSNYEPTEEWQSSFAPADDGEPGIPETAYQLVITGDGTLSIEMAGIEDIDEVGETEGEPYPSGLYGIWMSGSDIALFKADVSVTLGDANELVAVMAKAYHGAILTVADDAAFGAYVGPAYEARGIYCMVLQALESAKLDIEIATGAFYAYGVSGGFIAGGDSTTDILAGKAAVASAGIQAADMVQLSGNASLTTASAGILDEAPTPPAAAGIMLPSFGVLSGSYGISGFSRVPIIDPVSPESIEYAYAVSDDATLIATGEDAALVGEPDLSGHNVGGAIVSAKHGLAPLATQVWDGETPLGSAADDPYLYVRIPGAPYVERIAGDYANETSALIAASTFFESEYVVIARDDDFADALGATGLAGALGCPIVLTNREELSEAAAAEITRLGATKAYVIGGTGAIKEQVDDDLEALGVEVQPRVAGENSYDTSLECAKKIVELGGQSEEAIVAVSFNFQDALSISPLAYQYRVPIILQTWGDTAADRGFTDEAKAWLEGKELVVVGGTGAISDESLDGLHPAVRLWGEDGYETSNAIAEFGYENGDFGTTDVVFACGAQAPKGSDALAGSALAGKLRAPILLVNGNEEMEAVNTYTIDTVFADHAKYVLNVHVLGGSYVMPQELVDKIESLLTA